MSDAPAQKSQKTSKPQKIRRTKPTIFPLGFGISRVEDNFIVIDFFDQLFDGNDNNLVTIESIALPKERAKDLVRALNNAFLNEKQ